MRPIAPSLVVLVLAGCPSGNPRVLWLAPDQAETRAKLVDSQPNPY
jgi:hypothetical protein